MDRNKKDNIHGEDYFWRWFFVVIGLIIIIALSSIELAFGRPSQNVLLGSEVSFPNIIPQINWDDPRLTSTASSTPIPGSPVIFDESLDAGWDNWSSGIRLDTQARGVTPWGRNALLVVFDVPYGELYLHTVPLLIEDYHSLEFDIKTDISTHGEIIVELLREQKGLGEQSVAWYASKPVSAEGEWQHIIIPLENLNASTTIDGIRIQQSSVGRLYLDNVRFSSTQSFHERWVRPVSSEIITLDKKFQYPLTQIQSFTIPSDWVSLYGGSIVEENGKMIGVKLNDTHVALTVFAGGLLWTDYRFNLLSDWGAYDAVALVARFVDAENYLKCAFGGYGSYVAIYETKGGKQTLLGYGLTNIPAVEGWNNVLLGISVSGKEISCYKDNELVLKQQSESFSDIGTAGIELWTQGTTSGVMRIKDVYVTALPE